MNFDYEIIETSIMNTQVKTAIKLLVKNDGSISSRLKKLNKSSYWMSFDISLQNLKFHQAQRINKTI